MLFGCYGCLQFLAVEISSLTKMGPLAQAALAALLGRYLWACLDTLGLTYLWWTWHQDEPLYAPVPLCPCVGFIAHFFLSFSCCPDTLSATTACPWHPPFGPAPPLAPSPTSWPWLPATVA